MKRVGSTWRICLLAVMAGLLGAPAYATSTAVEIRNRQEMHITHVVNLLKFVSWPEQAERSERFILCVMGDNPFGNAVYNRDDLVMRSRPIRIIVDISPELARYCNAVYISSSRTAQLKESLAPLKGLPAVTVSDIEGFTQAGGMIEMRYNQLGKVTIRANQEAAAAEGLRISSKLLTLSK